MNVKWDVTDIKTGDYTAEIGELVLVDMLGKAAPDMVTITLPIATPKNKGRDLRIVTTNQGGAEDGSILRIAGQGQMILPSVDNFGDMRNHEIMVTLTSTGDAWIITSIR